MTDARLPDGTILRFPDGTADAVIDRAVKDHLAQAGGSNPVMDFAKNTGTAIVKGASDLLGMPRALMDIYSRGAAMRDPNADLSDPTQRSMMTPGVAGGIAGALPSSENIEANFYKGIGGGAQPYTPQTPAGRIYQGAVRGAVGGAPFGPVGAISGAAGGAGSAGAAEVGLPPLAQAAVGLVTGGVAGGVTGATRAAVAGSQFRSAAPSTSTLKTGGSAAFEAAEATGIALTPTKYTDFMTKTSALMTKEGLDPILHPGLTNIVKVMSGRSGQSPTIQDLMILRRQLNMVTPNTAQGEGRLAKLLRGELDRMIGALTPADLAGLGMAAPGTARDASKLLNQANMLWSRGKKSELIESMVRSAELTASGFENGLRIEFRKLLKNEKELAGFAPDEIALMEEIVKGSVGVNLAKLLGKFSFSLKGNNWLGGAMTGGFGYAAGGVPGALIAGGVQGTAMGSRALATAAQLRKAQTVRAMAASGGRFPRRPSNLPGIAGGAAMGTGLGQ